MYYKQISNQCIVCVGVNIGGIEITETEYNSILDLIRNKPQVESGYDNRLRADTLEWELVELPIIPPEDDEATTEDYAAALAELGVR